MRSRSSFVRTCAAIVAAGAFSTASMAVDVPPQGAAFTYGGEIKLAGAPVNGLIDLRFQVYNAEEGGSRIGGLRTKRNVLLTNGRFSTSVNFGATIYDRAEEAKWVEIQVRNPAGSGVFQTIRPRQAITVTSMGVYQVSGTPGPVGPAGAPGPAGASPFSLIGSNAVFLGGAVGVGSTMPMGTLELQGGDDGTASTAISQLSLAYAYGGGYRHFIRSRHSGVASSLNGVDLFLNNVADGNGSMAPGINNIGVFSINAAGQASFGTTDTPPVPIEFQLRSVGATNADLLIRPGASIAGSGEFGYNLGTDGSKLYIARSDGTTFSDRLVIDGVNGRVGFGTASPSRPLEVRADAYGISHTSVDGQSDVTTYVTSTAGWIGTVNNKPLFFYTNNSSAQVTLAPGGNLGIGTANPFRGKVEIAGIAGNGGPLGAHAYLNSSTTGSSGGPVNTPVSLYASGDIHAATFRAFSDERIKVIDGPSDSRADLATLTGIVVTDYTFKDTIAKGTGTQKKVIAQQVEKVYPQAVTKSTDVVPDIYLKAAVKDGWVQLITDLKVGERVRLIGAAAEAICEVVEVTDYAFRVNGAPDGAELFVYGREVSDFRTVDYEAIAMLNVSATQELARQNMTQQKRIDELEARLKALSPESTHELAARLDKLEALLGAKAATSAR